MAEKSITGGEALEARLNEIAAKLGKSGTLRVGFLEGSTYPDGTSVPMVAAIHEFGAPNAGIPPRPFMRTLVAEKANSWGNAVAKNLKAHDYEVEPALDAVGQGIAGQLQRQIIKTNDPPLSQVTLMLRKMRSEDQSLVVTGKVVGEAAARVAEGESTAGVNAKPLDDSGHLIKSVDYEVKA